MANDKKFLEEFNVIDGKERSEKEDKIEKTRNLEDLLGIKDVNPYGTNNKDVFSSNLGSMSVADMTTLAQRVGLPASSIDSPSILKKNLIKSFDIYVQQNNVTVAGRAEPVIDPKADNYDEVKRLFEL
ncbi:hypothetical protein N9973_00220 [bacterium]|nr:hypothetical protein [bacterium]